MTAAMPATETGKRTTKRDICRNCQRPRLDPKPVPPEFRLCGCNGAVGQHALGVLYALADAAGITGEVDVVCRELYRIVKERVEGQA